MTITTTDLLLLALGLVTTIGTFTYYRHTARARRLAASRPVSPTWSVVSRMLACDEPA